MSSSINIYFLKVDDLAAVIGANESGFADRVQSGNIDGVWYEPDDVAADDGEIDSRTAIEQINSGTLDPAHAADYARALDLICGTIGERVEAEFFEDFHYALIEELEVVDELLRSRLPFAFPSHAEFLCCYLSKQRIKAIVDEGFDDVAEHDDAEINAIRYEYLELLEAAAAEGTDIVAFYL